jgi:predicted membrane metal-binding protein
MPRWRKARMGEIRPGDAADAVFTVPDFGGLDELGVAVLALLAVMVVAIVVIPLLLFGIELILLGLLVATSIAGRTLLGRPWIVRATLLAGEAEGLTWRVVGWRRSNRLIDEVAASLAAGLDPSPAEESELISTA